MNGFLYIAQSGGHLAVANVKVRKMPEPVYPEPTGDADADAAARVAAEAEAAGKVRSFAIKPLAADGEKRVKVTRYNVSAETFAAYIAETDGEKRTALLAGIESLETAADIKPTQAQVATLRALVDRSATRDMLAQGIYFVPSDRAEKAAGTAAGNRKMTEAERTEAALDAMFGPEPEPETADGETVEPVADAAPEVTPEPVAESGRKSRP